MTAQESYRLYEEQKTKERNAKNYHIDKIGRFNGVVVATSDNWDYKLIIYSDNSASLNYIAKNEQVKSGFFCGISSLKNHLRHLCNIQYDTKWKSLFDGVNWTIKEPAFFEALGIN